MKMARLSKCIFLSLLNRAENPSLGFSVINSLLIYFPRRVLYNGQMHTMCTSLQTKQTISSAGILGLAHVPVSHFSWWFLALKCVMLIILVFERPNT